MTNRVWKFFSDFCKRVPIRSVEKVDQWFLTRILCNSDVPLVLYRSSRSIKDKLVIINVIAVPKPKKTVVTHIIDQINNGTAGI